MKGRNCIGIIETVRYNGIKVRQINYFGKKLFLFKINNLLHVSCKYKNVKYIIQRIRKHPRYDR